MNLQREHHLVQAGQALQKLQAAQGVYKELKQKLGHMNDTFEGLRDRLVRMDKIVQAALMVLQENQLYQFDLAMLPRSEQAETLVSPLLKNQFDLVPPEEIISRYGVSKLIEFFENIHSNNKIGHRRPT